MVLGNEMSVETNWLGDSDVLWVAEPLLVIDEREVKVGDTVELTLDILNVPESEKRGNVDGGELTMSATEQALFAGQ